MEKKPTKDIDVAKITKQMDEAVEVALTEDLLQKNEIEFVAHKQKYKVIRPTPTLRQETYKQRAKKHIELLQNDDFRPEIILKELYKKKGVDLDSLDNEMLVLDQKKRDYQLKTGEALKGKASDE